LIDFYTFPTPNGIKASIMLEEIKLPYNLISIHIGNNEQFSDEFLKINPNNKVPAIVDHDGPGHEPISVFESGAILIYLAKKVQSKLLPDDPRKSSIVMEWLMFQMANIGPMFGQMNHFLKYAKEDVPYGKQRYSEESKRILGVMEKRLVNMEYFAGDYSIADIATFGWVRSVEEFFKDYEEYPNIQQWYNRLGKRTAVKTVLSSHGYTI